jgi:hypothetical protein
MSRCEAFKPRNMFVCPRISKNTSIENQAAAITAYASERKSEIVKTYVDKGRSGLRINSRKDLQKLIADVQGHIHRHLRADAKEASAPDRSPALPPLLRRAASLRVAAHSRAIFASSGLAFSPACTIALRLGIIH